jgi:hypothetical protein
MAGFFNLDNAGPEISLYRDASIISKKKMVFILYYQQTQNVIFLNSVHEIQILGIEP